MIDLLDRDAPVIDGDTCAARRVEQGVGQRRGQDLPSAFTVRKRFAARVRRSPPDGVPGRVHGARAIDGVGHAKQVKQLAATRWNRFGKRREVRGWLGDESDAMAPERQEAGRGGPATPPPMTTISERACPISYDE